ncbi:MAG: phospho-N-acetylmuramoyl-pentapeptide-transferase [Alphaproteobacteria bacterium]|nr:phospho-N-acetylmuramoyl-pentapeptide-transferase [Alphaproteobacteria bacterium]
MFYNLIYKQLSSSLSCFNVFQYVTVRSMCAFLVAFFAMVLTGSKFINFIKKFQKNGQPIRDDGPQNHIDTKQGTPTMGGLLIISATIISSVLFGDLTNEKLILSLLVFASFGMIGAFDDYKKVSKQDYHGLSGKKKLIMQSLISVACVLVFIKLTDQPNITKVFIPLFKNFEIDLGVLFLVWSVFVMVGSSNAVNLTDGLDGLVIGPVITTSISFAIISYLAGNVIFSDYLHMAYIPGLEEVCIFLSSLVGASLGFMWFNAPPAKIFMGDTGSVAIGGVLGFISIISKHEFIYVVIGGIFVIETLSVIVQVMSYKLTKKRVFLMAPIHHHFEKKGLAESTVVFRFWIISIVLAIVGLALVKVR